MADFLDEWGTENANDAAENVSAFERDYQITSLKQVDGKRERVMTIPIKDIKPDLRQARRSLPHELREAWFFDSGAGVDIMVDWYERAMVEAEEYGRESFDPIEYFKDDGELSDDPPAGPIEDRLLKLLADARTAIPNEGVSTPISVFRSDDKWMIESGERRTLMHWALVAWYDAEMFSEIRALKTNTLDILSQAAENSARKDLNAIEQARQLALVLLSYYPDAEALQYFEADSDLVFYSQAVDLNMPYGKSNDVMALTGLSSQRQLSRYKALLRLPERVWDLADHFSWAEGKIRAMVNKAGGITNVDQLVHIAEIEAGLIAPQSPNFQVEVERKANQTINNLRRAANLDPDMIRALHPDDKTAIVKLAEEILNRYK